MIRTILTNLILIDSLMNNQEIKKKNNVGGQRWCSCVTTSIRWLVYNFVGYQKFRF